MNILITGGPVHAYLDAVKIITNRFKGGLMAELAEMFLSANDTEVTYLTSKSSKLPQSVEVENGDRIKMVNATILYHDGFDDYRKQVLKLAPHFDAVILGAAVANLIPLNPLVGKFPSHNYKVGDRIPIDFTIAPRVIEEVKAVAPNTHLFGFKLLSGVPHEELISAAYGVLLESKATAVFANDAKDLLHKYCVTKERSVHPMGLDDMVKFVKQCVNDTYYITRMIDVRASYPSSMDLFATLAERYGDKFKPTPEGYVFGTIAIRNPDGTIFTTSRGKHEINDHAIVHSVDHVKYEVFVYNGKKASLNAPLLDWIFKHNEKVQAIVHFHYYDPTVKHVLEYAIPGTVLDSQRLKSNLTESFYIKGHGSFLLLDQNLQPI